MSNPLTPATPLCPHFGTCGGCQYQDVSYTDQLELKRSRLEALLHESGIEVQGAFTVHSAEPYYYRNRIRLRIEREKDCETSAVSLRLGYNIRSSAEFLVITTCPIAAPVLWSTAESLLTAAALSRDAGYWMNAAAEVELFCNQDLNRVQIMLFCTPRTKNPPADQTGNFSRAFAAFQSTAQQIAGVSVGAFDPRTGPTGRIIAQAGAPGLTYTVPVAEHSAETYWVTGGAFFQVNRFLLPMLARLVCTDASGHPRTGHLAWDLFAGVGLFSRILARTFNRITAVEANPTAAADLRSALAKLTPVGNAVQSTTVEFLRRAILDRDRPDLIVLDPPRAGAGIEACDLLNRIAAPTIVYVSCDPDTLARDLATLQPTYRITTLHLLDLFPQTSHLETVAILQSVVAPVPLR